MPSEKPGFDISPRTFNMDPDIPDDMLVRAMLETMGSVGFRDLGFIRTELYCNEGRESPDVVKTETLYGTDNSTGKKKLRNSRLECKDKRIRDVGFLGLENEHICARTGKPCSVAKNMEAVIRQIEIATRPAKAA